jgi:hypothetical protein
MYLTIRIKISRDSIQPHLFQKELRLSWLRSRLDPRPAAGIGYASLGTSLPFGLLPAGKTCDEVRA